jgi:hypothetical protein
VRRRWSTTAGAAGLVVLAAIGAAGCAANTPGAITPAATRILAPAVQHVREVAATNNYGQLQAAVAQLLSLVRQEQQAGAFTDSRAAAIMDAADILLSDAKPTPTPTSTSPTPSPTSESPTPTSSSTPSLSPTPSSTPSTTSPTPTPSQSASAQAGGFPTLRPTP